MLEMTNVPPAQGFHSKHSLLSQADDSKEQVSISLQRDALDRITGNDWSDLHHSPTTNSNSHNAQLQDVTFPAAFLTAPGTCKLC